MWSEGPSGHNEVRKTSIFCLHESEKCPGMTGAHPLVFTTCYLGTVQKKYDTSHEREPRKESKIY